MADAPTSLVAIRPLPDRRLIVPAGCMTLPDVKGISIPLTEGADLPAEGALVPREVWAARCIGRGDAEPVPPPTPAQAARPAPAAPAVPAAGA